MSSGTGDPKGHPRPEAESRATWLFGPAEAPVRVAGADLLLAHLPVFLGGWPLRWAGEEREDAPVDIAVREAAGGGISVETSGSGGAALSFDNPLDAADGLADALVAAFVAARAGHFCLHAGSALVGGGLAVVTGDSLSGRSSIALQLAASGYRLFGDDRIALRVGAGGTAEGLCLGLMPRLRLPLPEDCGPRLAGFVESYTEIRSETTVYLRPWDTEAAAFGDTAPLKAFVALERGGDSPAALAPAPAEDIAHTLVRSVFAPQLSAEALVAAMTELAGTIPCYRLRWTQSAAAARVLADALAGRGCSD